MADIRTSGFYNRISFTVITSAGGSKTATLTNPYDAGVYTIQSIAGDTDIEIYLGAEDGTNVGSSAAGAKAIIASGTFKYVTTVNANTSDAIIFTLYQSSSDATTLATKTDAFWAPPAITDITPSGLYNQNATTVITGSNFASNAGVQFRKSDDATLISAKSVTRTSATSITATRPDSFLTTDAPYDVVVTNATTGLSAISLNAVTAGSAPSWSTSAALPAFQKTVAYSQAVVATDADASPTLSYSVNSSTLPSGITFSAGTFSGTPTANTGSYSASIRATDLGGNYVDRTFTLAQVKPDAPTITAVTATGTTTATVEFTLPAYAGTSAITTYTATSSPGSLTATLSQAGSGTINFTGLTQSTAYTFTLTATNSSGISLASSASSSITTFAPVISLEYLVVAGGGSGASGNNSSQGGGGGAGGYRTNYGGTKINFNSGISHTITIGGGGAGRVGSNNSTGVNPNGGTGNSGSNSSITGSGFTTISSTGGGGGGAEGFTVDSVAGKGHNGGSGGGGASATYSLGNAGSYSPVEGYAGGNSASGGAGGGGGSSAVGGNGRVLGGSDYAGDGGAGTSNLITNEEVVYAGGGGGAVYYGYRGNAGGGGSTQGGRIAEGSSNAAENTGGGSGGSANRNSYYYASGNGGSGIVVINAPQAAASTSGSPTYTNPSAGVYIYKFTSTGSITF